MFLFISFSQDYSRQEHGELRRSRKIFRLIWLSLGATILFYYASHVRSEFTADEKLNWLLILLPIMFLLVATITDWQVQKVPNALLIRTLLLIIAFFLLSFAFLPWPEYKGIWQERIMTSFVLTVFLYIGRVISQGGIGMGDIKLCAILSLCLGLRMSVITLSVAFISAAILILFLYIFHRTPKKRVIPFIPFVLLGYVLSFVYEIFRAGI